MNTIGITVKHDPNESGKPYPAIHINIDGRDLIDMLKEYELPFAKREGHSNIAGGYSGLDARATTRELFFGQDDSREDGRSAIFECTCGEGGCWPLLVRITVRQDTVLWTDFEQPHRRRESASGFWDYASFGPFEFDREQYETEVKKIG